MNKQAIIITYVQEIEVEIKKVNKNIKHGFYSTMLNEEIEMNLKEF
jgi:hypothetical protein